MKRNHSALFTPIDIGSVTMKNRIEAAPGLPQSHLTLRNLIFAAERAAGGAGLVCLGEAVVHARTGYCHKDNITLDDEDNATTLLELSDAIRRYGALSSIQLIHSGRRANPKYLVGGDRVYGPSAGEGIYGNRVHELTEELIEEIVEAFAHGAMLAKFSGLDMVMVHAAHGWLPQQFLSPLNNQRADRFGGSLENRARFTLMIVDRIKKACGKDYPVDVRISGAELYEGGYGIDDMVEFAKLLDGKADMIHVSASTFHNRDGMVRLYPSQYAEHGLNVEYARRIREAVSIPVAVVGAMDLPELMEDAVATGKADIVALGRALLADEQFPKKMLLGMERDITPCIRCQYCVSGGFVPYVPIVRGTMRCAVNPARGREYENVFARGAGRLPVASLADADLADAGLAAGRLPLAGLAVGSRAGAGLADAGQPPVSQTATDQPAAGRAGGSRTGGSRAGASWAASSCGALRRRALIIGGGPAGMEAAIAASDFGHEAILCEKSGSLGGMLRAAGKLPYKSDIRRFLDTLSYRVGARAIDVRLNTEVTPEMAAAMDADAIICAIGAMPATPPIPGLGRALPVHLMREGGAAVGERVVIVGGGLAGIEEAIGLAREGRQVTVVEMAGDIAAGAPYILYRSTVLETQKHPNLKVLTHTECVEVTERGVVVRCAGGGEVGGSAGASAGASVRGSAGGAGAGSGGGAGADAGAGAGACAEPAGMPELTELAADTVISAVGFVPRRSEAEAFRGCTDDFCAIGDCRAVGQVLGAMHDGYDAACRL